MSPSLPQRPDITPSVLLTSREVAAILGVSIRTVRRYAADGLLAPIRIGSRMTRYDRADVERLIARSAVTTGAAGDSRGAGDNPMADEGGHHGRAA